MIWSSSLYVFTSTAAKAAVAAGTSATAGTRPSDRIRLWGMENPAVALGRALSLFVAAEKQRQVNEGMRSSPGRGGGPHEVRWRGFRAPHGVLPAVKPN